MKIGFDLHGVISDLPEVFKFIGESIIKNSGEVHILTGSNEIKAIYELREIGFIKDIHYTHIFSVQDFLDRTDLPSKSIHPKYGNLEYVDIWWDRAKARYCKDNDINLHLDDTAIYGDYFGTPFARVFTKTNTPKINKPDRHLN